MSKLSKHQRGILLTLGRRGYITNTGSIWRDNCNPGGYVRTATLTALIREGFLEKWEPHDIWRVSDKGREALQVKVTL